MRFGGEFYSIDAKNTLGTLNPSVLSTYVTNANLYTYNVTPAQYSALLATLTNGASLGTQRASTDIGLIADTRTTNLNAAKLEGIDFHVFYDTTTSAGHFAFGVAGTYQTKAFITNGGVASDRLGIGSPRLFTTSFAGWEKGRVSAKLTINYSGRFNDEAVNNLGISEDVDPFVLTNLSLGYKIEDTGGALDGTSFRLGVDNVFDVQPQTIRRLNTNNNSYNNFTLGRIIKLGASKKF